VFQRLAGEPRQGNPTNIHFSEAQDSSVGGLNFESVAGVAPSTVNTFPSYSTAATESSALGAENNRSILRDDVIGGASSLSMGNKSLLQSGMGMDSAVNATSSASSGVDFGAGGGSKYEKPTLLCAQSLINI
jgi:hypothetical protein